jgi:hypothetical protein
MTMTQKLIRTVLSSLAVGGLAVTLSGCELALLVSAISDDETYDDYEEYGYYGEGVNAQIETLSFEGVLGETSFDGATMGDAWTTDDTATISLYATNAMTNFFLAGEKRQQLFTAGSSIVLDGADNYGCSGANYEYEADPVTGTLEVEESEDPNMLLVNFALDYGSGQYMTGSFELAKL